MKNSAFPAGEDSKPLTTFVHADTKSFREVVQRLTGPSETDTSPETTVPNKEGNNNVGVRKPTFKLHERRQYRAKLEIIKPPLRYRPGSSSAFPRADLRSPDQQQSFSLSASWNLSPLATPTRCFSNLTLGQKVSPDLNIEEEEKAIKERRFYLHPSPRANHMSSEPALLNLFPLSSPDRMKGS